MFCQEYVKDLNGTQAAIRAEYDEKSARHQASRLLTNDHVCALIKQLNEKKLRSVKVDAETILTELLRLATSDIRKLFNENGGILPPNEWPDDIAKAVSSIQVDELFDYDNGQKNQVGLTKKIKLWDKNAALDKLAKHLGLLVDRIEVNGKVTLEELVNGSFKK